MHKFLPNAKISQSHGQAVRVKGRLVVPFYHPAAALHQPSLRPTVEADFARLPEWIKKAGDVPEYVELSEPAQDEDKPEQLSLF
jgi:DNA polymerase